MTRANAVIYVFFMSLQVYERSIVPVVFVRDENNTIPSGVKRARNIRFVCRRKVHAKLPPGFKASALELRGTAFENGPR